VQKKIATTFGGRKQFSQQIYPVLVRLFGKNRDCAPMAKDTPFPHISFEPVGAPESSDTTVETPAEENKRIKDLRAKSMVTSNVFVVNTPGGLWTAFGWFCTIKWMLIVSMIAYISVAAVGMIVALAQTNVMSLPLTAGYASITDVGGTLVFATKYTSTDYRIWMYSTISGGIGFFATMFYLAPLFGSSGWFGMTSTGYEFVIGNSGRMWTLHGLLWFEFTMWTAHIAGFTDVFAVVGGAIMVAMGMGMAYLHERGNKYRHSADKVLSKATVYDGNESNKIRWNSAPLWMFIIFTFAIYAYIGGAAFFTVNLPTVFVMSIYLYCAHLFLFQVIVLWHWWGNLKDRTLPDHPRYVRRMHWWLLLVTMLTHAGLTTISVISYSPPVWDTTTFWMSA